jgi:predicted phosphodiesterase
MADVQYCDCNTAGSRAYRASLQKLKEAVDTFNLEKVDMVFHLGDFIDRDIHSFDTLNKIAAGLECPFYLVPGNHDFNVKPYKPADALAAMHLKRPYYAVVKDGWRLIALNGNDVSLYGTDSGSAKYKQAADMFDKLKKEHAPNAYDWNGAIGKKQITWLKKQLKTARKKGQQVIVFCHFPLYPEKGHEILWNAAEIRPLIESSPQVMAYLNGHVHRSQYFRENGMNYVSFKGIVQKDGNAFAIVSVFRDHLEIKGYEKEISRTLSK